MYDIRACNDTTRYIHIGYQSVLQFMVLLNGSIFVIVTKSYVWQWWKGLSGKVFKTVKESFKINWRVTD